MGRISYILKKSWYFAWHRHHFLIPLPVLKNYAKSFFRYLSGDSILTKDIFVSPRSYNKWRKHHKIVNIKNKYQGLFTIIYPIKDYDNLKVEKAIDSIMELENKFQLIIGLLDNNLKIEKLLKKYDNNKYELIKFPNKTNLADMYNKMIKKAKGDYIALVNSNMILESQILNYAGNLIVNNKHLDIIYFDEDQIIDNDYCNPQFKPDWALTSYLGERYFGNFTIINKSLIKKAGNFDCKINDYCYDDYLLKCISLSNVIMHSSNILFHDYANEKKNLKMDKILLENYLKFNNLKGEIIKSDLYDGLITKFHHNNPLVSIIIPFKNQFKFTKDCVEGILAKLSYKNYEIILIDNNSDDVNLLKWLDEISKKHKSIVVLKYPQIFNFAKICNFGVKHSKGDYYLFLNNDTQIIDGDYLDWMVGYASLNHVGAVGMKLLFDDRKVQHMGVVLTKGCYANHYYATFPEDYPGYYNMCLRPYNFSAVTGACLLIGKEKFKEIKGFDEKLAVALNDVDLCIKLLDKGYQNVCMNNKKMFHFESKSRGYDETSEKRKRLAKEYKYLQSKWLKKYSVDKYCSKYFF